MRRLVVEQKKDISSLANEKRGRGELSPYCVLKERAVKFVIPNKELNQSQLKAIERIIDYGNLNNVKIEIDIMLK